MDEYNFKIIIKKLNMKSILSTALILFVLSTSAQDFILFDNEKLTGDFSGGIVGTSTIEANNNGFNSIKVIIDYKDINPDVCDCSITAVIEEEIYTDVWVAIANQFEGFAIEGNTSRRIIVLSPQFNSNPGTDEVIAVPNGNIRVSNTTGVAPSKFRLRIYVQDFGGNGLQSLTLSAYGRKFNQ